MNALPEPVIQDVYKLLQQLSINDTWVVNHARNNLEKFLSKPDSVPIMVWILQNGQEPSVRQRSAVLLRQKIAGHWNEIGSDSAWQIKDILFNISVEEPNDLIRNSVVDLICSLAKEILPDGRWPDFWQRITQMAGSNGQQRLCPVLQIIGELYMSITDYMSSFLDDIFHLLNSSLQPVQDPVVRIAAVNTASKVVKFLEEDQVQVIEKFSALMPLMIEVVGLCVQNGAESETVTCLEHFSGIIKCCPKVLPPHSIKQLCNLCLSTAKSFSMNLEIRTTAMFFIRDIIVIHPSWVTKYNLLGDILLTCFSMMSEPEELDPSLYDVEDSPFQLGENIIAEISSRIKAEYAFDPIMDFVNQFCTSDNYWKRRAALGAMAAIVSGYSEQLEPMLDKLVNYLVSVFPSDGNDVFILRSACDFLEELANVFGDVLDPYHHKLLPLILRSLQSRNPVMDCVLYLAMEYFATLSSENISDETAEQLINRLMEIVQGPESYDIKSVSMDVIATLSAILKVRIVPFWSSIVSVCHSFLGLKDGNALVLKGHALDCIGVVAVSVGKEIFSSRDLEFFFQIAVQILESKDVNSELWELALNFLSNLSETLEQEFVPFLEPSLMFIMNILKDDDDSGLGSSLDENLDFDFDEMDAYEDDDEFANYQVGSGTLQSIYSALQTLSTISKSIGGAFFPYIDRFMPILLNLTKHKCTKVRSLSFMPLVSFATCYNRYYLPQKPWSVGLDPVECQLAPQTKNFLDSLIQMLLHYIDTDYSQIVILKNLEFLKELLDDFGRPGFDTHISNVIELLRRIFHCKFYQRIFDLGYADPEDEDLLQSMVLIFDEACEVLTSVGENYKFEMIKYFDLLQSVSNHVNLFESKEVSTIFSDSSLWYSSALACLSEFVHKVGNIKNWPNDHARFFLEQGLKFVNYPDKAIRSNAIYLLRLMVEHPLSFEIYPQILESVGNSLSDPYNQAHDNALGCIGNMIICAPNLVPLDRILEPFLKSFPLKVDVLESPYAYGCLFKILDDFNPQLTHLLLKTFLKALVSSIVQKDIENNIVAAIKFIFERNKNNFVDLCKSLDEEERNKLGHVLNV